MKLEEVLEAFRNGRPIRRRKWPERDCYVVRAGEGILALRPVDIIATDWEIEQPPLKTKTVWQWRSLVSGAWELHSCLLTKKQASNYFYSEGREFEEHAGPFEVPE